MLKTSFFTGDERLSLSKTGSTLKFVSDNRFDLQQENRKLFFN